MKSILETILLCFFLISIASFTVLCFFVIWVKTIFIANLCLTSLLSALVSFILIGLLITGDKE